MQKYIFFLDVDGTLIEHGKDKITTKVVEEIKRLKALGHIFVICTGRSHSHAKLINNLQDFNYLAILFGSRIYNLDNDKIEYKSKNPNKKATIALADYLLNKKISWSYKDEIGEKTPFLSMVNMRDDKDLVLINREDFLRDVKHGKIIQLLATGRHKAELEPLFPEFDFFDMPDNYTDITRAGVSKEQCVNFFKKRFPNYTTVSMGDSQNDLDMFARTDISIAMGNASDEIKAKAKYVTKRVQQDGVAYALTTILKL